MNDNQEMTKALLDFVGTYAEQKGLSSADILTALAHGYVIYGFSVKQDNTSYDTMRDALISFVTNAADHMIGAIHEEA